ncbi:tyrosine-type recombinase/integrase [Desulfosporosinus sp. PR]|uniref:tyrosine-type recombinase/integrase n=1 Tax=Candidatus Desulfosporosinus nitrosoreducens TaxID=3401928 RepID=UPI0027F65DEB|nr:tyrosine-type recombinase/integrase [Desulfosporosinus sp. PR]MDQ7095987.1 tyrosine-type recombinase/integrase [Desulfosporosinus sp. PR]
MAVPFTRRRGCTCWQKKCTCGATKKTNCTCGASKSKINKCTCGAKWEYILEAGINPKTGKRWQPSKGGFATKKEAEDAGIIAQNDILNKTFIIESDISFGDFVPKWEANYITVTGVKNSTLRARKFTTKRLIKYFGYRPMKDISKKDYQEMLNDLKNKGYAHETIASTHQVARLIFNLAITWEYIKIDPTKGAKIPADKLTVEQIETQEDVPKYLEKEQLAKFLKAAEKFGLEKDFEIFMALAYLGLRTGELCALYEEDLKSDEGLIRITKTLYNPTENRFKYEITTPKTKKSIRDITIEDDIKELLNKLIVKNNILKMKHRKTYHKDRGKYFLFVITEEDAPGFPLYHQKIQYRMKRLLKIAGLDPSLSPHVLRHTHVSLLAEAGVSLQDIMDRVGHEDEKTTRRIYLHVTKPKRKEASHAFGKLMGSLL